MYQSQIRIKDLTANKLKYIAEKSCRSMNQQIDYILLQFIADYEKVNGKIDLTDCEE